MISIIIPTHNRSNVLLRSVKSAYQQTFQQKEIIVVDDYSYFDVERFLNRRLPKDAQKQLKVIKNNSNLGPSASRNIGVKAAKGKYIAFLDSDDYWDKNKLKKQIQKFEEDVNLDLVYCDQKIIRNGKIFPSGKKMINTEVTDFLLTGWTPPNPSTLLFKKDSFLALGGFDEELKASEDHELWFRLANAELNISSLEEPLSYFTQDLNDRLSLDLERRVYGVKKMTEKCRVYLRPDQIQEFYKMNIFKVCSPIFFASLKSWNLSIAFSTYFRFLYNNSHFYKRVLDFLSKRHKRLKKEERSIK